MKGMVSGIAGIIAIGAIILFAFGLIKDYGFGFGSGGGGSGVSSGTPSGAEQAEKSPIAISRKGTKYLVDGKVIGNFGALESFVKSKPEGQIYDVDALQDFPESRENVCGLIKEAKGETK